MPALSGGEATKGAGEIVRTKPAGTSALVVGQNALSTSAEMVIAANPNRRCLELVNTDGTISMYVGPTAGVLTTTGYLLKAGVVVRMEGYTGPIYAIAASGTPSISFMEW